MAGWLFADLLLVLFLVGMGTQASVAPPPPPPPVPKCPPVLPPPAPPPAPECPPPPSPGLAKESVSIPLEVRYEDLLSSGDARRRAVEDLRRQVTAAVAVGNALGGDRAGMVLVWSYHDDIDKAMRIATAVKEELPQADTMVFGDSTLRPFWRGGRQARSHVVLEVYVLK